METINIVDFARRGEMTDGRADGFAENRRQQLIATAVEAEFVGYPGAICRLAD